MKKLFIILIGLFLIMGCLDTGIIPDIQDSGPDIITPTFEKPIILALYDGVNLRFWDGERLHDAYSGNVKQAGHRKLSVDEVLFYFDEKGNVIQSNWLPANPEALKAVPNKTASKGITDPKGVIVYNDSIYTLENIPPDEAYALGAQYKDYTKIYINNVVQGLWYLNEWKVEKVIKTLSGHIIAIDTGKHYHNLTDKKVVYYATDNGLLIYDIDDVNYTAKIADDSGIYDITWKMGYFLNSQWQKAGDKWYSQKGYTFDHAYKVISNANKMYLWNDWNTLPAVYDASYKEMPYLLSAGVRLENSEEVTYWIECVTGYLYRHIPSIDKLDRITELYKGPYIRPEAAPYFKGLKPEIIDNKLYYHVGGMVKTYDFTTGMVSLFSKEMGVIKW